MSVERRYHPRIELSVTTEIRYRGRAFAAPTGNISSGGVQLKSSGLSLASGVLLELELRLSEHRWLVSGIVVYSRPPRCGLLFRVPQPELFMAAIGEPIQLSAAPPPLPAQAAPSRY